MQKSCLYDICHGALLANFHSAVWLICVSWFRKRHSNMMRSCVETWRNRCAISLVERQLSTTWASSSSFRAESIAVVLSLGCITKIILSISRHTLIRLSGATFRIKISCCLYKEILIFPINLSPQNTKKYKIMFYTDKTLHFSVMLPSSEDGIFSDSFSLL